MYPRKDRRGQVLDFSPLSKCNVLWRQDYAEVQQNRPGCDQGRAPLGQWIFSMVFHNRRRRANSTLPSTVTMLRKEK